MSAVKLELRKKEAEFWKMMKAAAPGKNCLK